MRQFVFRICLCLAMSSLISMAADGQEWTRFRGPNGTGLSRAKSLPASWSEADYNWRVELPGQGHSSPVLWGDKIFLMSADPQDATQYVLCYSATDGSLLWRRDYPSSPHHLHLRNTFASGTPAVDGERVYVAWSTPEKVNFLALDHQGNDVWSLDLGTWTSQHGFGLSPMLFEDLVILSNNQQAQELDPGQKPGESYMLALDAKTGAERWRTPRTSIRVCYSTPCIYQPGDRPPQLICTSTAEGVFSLDPRTGKENWRVPDCFRMRVVSSPLVTDRLIFGSNGSGGGGNYLVAVRPDPQPAKGVRGQEQCPVRPVRAGQGRSAVPVQRPRHGLVRRRRDGRGPLARTAERRVFRVARLRRRQSLLHRRRRHGSGDRRGAGIQAAEPKSAGRANAIDPRDRRRPPVLPHAQPFDVGRGGRTKLAETALALLRSQQSSHVAGGSFPVSAFRLGNDLFQNPSFPGGDRSIAVRGLDQGLRFGQLIAVA
jgi:outer membrane protein assembly factor BamB